MSEKGQNTLPEGRNENNTDSRLRFDRPFDFGLGAGLLWHSSSTPTLAPCCSVPCVPCPDRVVRNKDDRTRHECPHMNQSSCQRSARSTAGSGSTSRMSEQGHTNAVCDASGRRALRTVSVRTPQPSAISPEAQTQDLDLNAYYTLRPTFHLPRRLQDIVCPQTPASLEERSPGSLLGYAVQGQHVAAPRSRSPVPGPGWATGRWPWSMPDS